VQGPENHLRRVVWAGTAALAGFVLIGVFLNSQRFRGTHGSSENGQSVLRDAAGRVLLDPWRNPYVYIAPTPEHPEARVISLGSDGRFGGEGDAADIDSDTMRAEDR